MLCSLRKQLTATLIINQGATPMSDTKIETEVELFDVLAKYGISKVTLQFKAEDYLELGDVHAMTFNGKTMAYGPTPVPFQIGGTQHDCNSWDNLGVPADVRDAMRLAIETFGRARADTVKYYNDEDDQEPAYWEGPYEDWPTVTFDVACREISFEAELVQITGVSMDWKTIK